MPVVPNSKRSHSAISDNIKQQIYIYVIKPENKNKN